MGGRDSTGPEKTSGYISRYWELTFRNVEGLGGVPEGVHRMEESRAFHQDLLSPLEVGSESEMRPQQMVCYRAGEQPEGLDKGMEGKERGRKGEDLKLSSLLPWLEWPESSHGMPVGVGGWDKSNEGGRKDLCCPPKSGGGGKRGFSRCSAVEPGIRLGEWPWRS